MMMNQLSFQDGVSPLMITISQFHDYAMSSIIFILILVAAFMSTTILYSSSSIFDTSEGLSIEAGWTSLPSIILLSLASASMWLLYELEDRNIYNLTPSGVVLVKAEGLQWYWSYDYSDLPDLQFDSYMVPTSDGLMTGEYRLLEVDARMVLPWNTPVWVFVTAADVLHAWTVPSLGVKVDAVPGRLNLIKFSSILPGVYYGQCSEICGANHSYMPIVIEVIKPQMFMNWAQMN